MTGTEQPQQGNLEWDKLKAQEESDGREAQVLLHQTDVVINACLYMIPRATGDPDSAQAAGLRVVANKFMRIAELIQQQLKES